jgi:hypothetical protein
MSVLWRRVDTPGHDACRLERTEGGWRVTGMAVFRHERGAAQLHYEATCDGAWHSQEGRVHGALDMQPVDFTVSRTAEGLWMLNGKAVPGLSECVDLDFDFTPATNLFQIRRLALTRGQAADAPAAWLDVSSGTLAALPQRYERIADATYRYEAPVLNYEADLQIAETGFVGRYPRLWELED